MLTKFFLDGKYFLKQGFSPIRIQDSPKPYDTIQLPCGFCVWLFGWPATMSERVKKSAEHNASDFARLF